MKINKAIREIIIIYINNRFEGEKVRDLNEFKILVIQSGVSREKSFEFICENKINYQRLEEEMASDENFFLSLSSNLLSYLNVEQRVLFQKVLRKFGYILGVNKLFRKAKKMELVDYGKEKKVKKIEIYRDKDYGRFRVAVNDLLIRWQKPKGNTDKHYLEYIYEIAEKGKSEIINAGKAKGVQQWFNSKKDNPIYKYSGITPTKILEYEEEFFYPASGIIIKKMSQKKAYLKNS